jgi:hypothetical protein
VTETDKPAFVQAIGRLAVALRCAEPDVVQMRVYFEALGDIEIEFVTEAATRLMRGEFFPTTGTWRAMAERIERERRAAQRALLRRLPAPLCGVCDDTGWRRDADERVRRCHCVELRRLEVLGRSPWPSFPEPMPTAEDVSRD